MSPTTATDSKNDLVDAEKGNVDIPITSLSPKLRDFIEKKKLDVNGDGRLDAKELTDAIYQLASTHQTNKTLKKAVYGLCIFAVLLTACVFGATITGARLAKDYTVDPTNGFMTMNRGDSGMTMKTSEALIKIEMSNIHGMSMNELAALDSITFLDGKLIFKVKGVARGEDTTVVLIEGGTLMFDKDGFLNNTGDAPTILFDALNVAANSDSGDRQLRFLVHPSAFIRADK